MTPEHKMYLRDTFFIAVMMAMIFTAGFLVGRTKGFNECMQMFAEAYK